ncbi:MAG: phosphatase PAP2 family protein [Gammaproteobacteria bacterium]|nr:phosphatase PAP2 family protein [Gammaproteobacteria bacterium]
MSQANVWQRISAVDGRLCLLLNRMSRRHLLVLLFRFISRIGDGLFWYALMAVLPLLYGERGLVAAGLMVLAGLINLQVYRLCKHRFARERPFVSMPRINLAGVPLDRYSFPSGHTQHAVGFSVVAVAFFPHLAMALFVLAALVALSRPLLGLHYPSDVVLGAGLGFGVAQLLLGVAALSGWMA